MAGRYQGFHFLHGDDNEGYVGFEVFWQQDGWFWRPLLTLDGEAFGPFTKSTEAYESAMLKKKMPTITALANALAKAGIELGENGSIFPRPKGKAR